MKEKVKNVPGYKYAYAAICKEFKFKNHKISGKAVITHPMFSGSAFMIIGSNAANFFAYIYHLVIGRMLGPESYSELAAMISIITMFTVSFGFLSLVIVKFVSSANIKEIEPLLSWFAKKAVILGCGIGLLAMVIVPFLSNFLHLENKLVVLLGPILFFSVFSMVFRSFLQGLLRFKQVAILASTEMLFRLVISVLLVYVGMQVYGAIFAVLVAMVIVVGFSWYMIKEFKIFGVADKFSGGKSVLKYTIPIFFVSIATNSFFSTDVVLVKHYLDSYNAGIYASVSNLGKIIFFGTAPVSAVMFPVISKKHSKGEGVIKMFFVSVLMVVVIGLLVMSLYAFLPELMVGLLYGKEFLEASKYLLPIGMFMSVFTIASLITNYYLSQNKTKVAVFMVIASISQAFGIYLFHDDIITVIKVSLVSVILLLASLVGYLIYETKKESLFKDKKAS